MGKLRMPTARKWHLYSLLTDCRKAARKLKDKRFAAYFKKRLELVEFRWQWLLHCRRENYGPAMAPADLEEALKHPLPMSNYGAMTADEELKEIAKTLLQEAHDERLPHTWSKRRRVCLTSYRLHSCRACGVGGTWRGSMEPLSGSGAADSVVRRNDCDGAILHRAFCVGDVQ